MTQEIDLKQFEWQIVTRPMEIGDYEAIVAMQQRCFGNMATWKREQIESQLRIFPEGQLVIECDGKLAASSSSLIVSDDDQLEWHNYWAVSDQGYIRTHDPKGDVLYGIEIMVDPEFRGMRLSQRLYEARKEICRQKNLRGIIIGGRLPGYHEHAKDMTAREYVDAVMNKSLYDPVLTAQAANGFILEGLIANYLASDVESCGYATYLRWNNLDYLNSARRKRFRRSVQQVRIAVVQYQMRRVDSFDEFAKQASYFADVASDYKSDFLLFPELFTTQLLSLIPPQRPGPAARALAAYTPQFLELFTELAVKHDTNIIGGSQFVVEDDLLYNIAFLFRRDGSIGKQYKIHVTPSERRWWGVTGGDTLEVLDTDCGPISIQICYDSEFPELTRMAVDRGANIIFVPYNTDTRNGHLRVRTCAHARCIENHVYVAIAGCTGNLPFVDNADIHYAQSAILTPCDVMFARDGIGAEANANIETVIMHDVDLEMLRRHRQNGTVQNWNDRRVDLYRVHYKVGNGERSV